MPIRVGIINCDTHATYFGPQMQRHDPLFFRQPLPPGDPKAIHSWLKGSNHYYFYTFYNDPTRMTVPTVGGFQIVKLWDRDRHVAELARQLFNGKPRICDTFDQVSDDVDLVMIFNCNYLGDDNLRLATPGLKKGVPHFVDKPFAHRLADVRKMLDLSKKHNAPITSLSILQCVPAVHTFREQLSTLGEIHFATIQGGGTRRDGLVHSVCLALTAFGSGVRAVRVLKAGEHVSFHLQYIDGRGPLNGVMINAVTGAAWHGAFQFSAFGPGYPGAIHSRGVGDWEYPQGSAAILKHVRRMVRTGRSQGPTDDQIEAIAICDAAAKALSRHDDQPVRVASL